MIVYKVTFPNNKCYVGITSKSLEVRKKTHYKRVNRNYNWKFYNALRKYKGAEKWEVLDTATYWEELCCLEILYIEHFDSCKKGYNSTSGGEGNYNPCKEVRGKMSKWQKGRKLSKEHKRKLSLAKLGKSRGPHKEETKKKMSLWHKKNSHMKGKTGSKHHNSKKIICVELNKTFECITECAEILNIHRNSIVNVLGNRAKSAGGYTFKYADKKEN